MNYLISHRLYNFFLFALSALSLLNGQVVMEFNLGTGFANVISIDRVINTGVWHVIVAQINGNEGRVQVNGGNTATARCKSTFICHSLFYCSNIYNSISILH